MPHRRSLAAPFLALLLASSGACLLSAAHHAETPNIVVILADDLGYGDVQPLNPHSQIPTPHLNRLAAEGMTFTDAHTPSAVCTPTRYGLLTGRYCWRSRLKRGVLNGYGPPLIERDRPTIGDLLKSHSYTTGVVGKWHLGLGFAQHSERPTDIDYTRSVDHGPGDLGFDESYIIPASLDFPPYVHVKNHRIVSAPSEHQSAWPFPAYVRTGPKSPEFDMAGTLDHLLAQAQHFIRDQAKQPSPFFLYFPLTAPHKPVLPHPRFLGTTDRGLYGDFVHQVDWTVGQILDTIAETGIKDRTLLIFTSDNGSFMYRLENPAEPDHLTQSSIQAYQPHVHTANGPLRGTKADVWEAGHRVPFFAMWPACIRPGSRSDHTLCLTDVMATLAEIVDPGGSSPVGEDSHSFLATLRGTPDQQARRPPVIHHSSGGMFAIREGAWKLVLGNGSGGRQNPRGRPFQRPFHLFDLERDLGETFNLAEDQPEVVQRLTATFETIAKIAVPQ